MEFRKLVEADKKQLKQIKIRQTATEWTKNKKPHEIWDSYTLPSRIEYCKNAAKEAQEGSSDQLLVTVYDRWVAQRERVHDCKQRASNYPATNLDAFLEDLSDLTDSQPVIVYLMLEAPQWDKNTTHVNVILVEKNRRDMVLFEPNNQKLYKMEELDPFVTQVAKRLGVQRVNVVRGNQSWGHRCLIWAMSFVVQALIDGKDMLENANKNAKEVFVRV